MCFFRGIINNQEMLTMNNEIEFKKIKIFELMNYGSFPNILDKNYAIKNE